MEQGLIFCIISKGTFPINYFLNEFPSAESSDIKIGVHVKKIKKQCEGFIEFVFIIFIFALDPFLFILANIFIHWSAPPCCGYHNESIGDSRTLYMIEDYYDYESLFK